MTKITFMELIGMDLGAIAATAAFLFIFGLGFNQLINYLHRRGWNDGFTWLEVVIGDTVVVLAAGFTLGWGAALLMFIYFAAAGFWMAAGDIWRHVRARQLEAQERES